MEQISYEIILALLKNKMHIKKIAETLETNQMSILRKLRRLQKENIVDFTKEGKNNIYSIKKTEEAKAFVFMSEYYRIIDALKKYPVLRKIFSEIRKNKRVSLAAVFGSYAKGSANKESDIDIYVDTKDKKLAKEIELLDSKISVHIGRYSKESILIKEIEQNHIIIKGVEDFYGKNKFFD